MRSSVPAGASLAGMDATKPHIASIGDGVRLTNARNLPEHDGDGFYIRDGIIVVPKGGTVPAGTVV